MPIWNCCVRSWNKPRPGTLGARSVSEPSRSLHRTEQPVASVAESRPDVLVGVEFAVERSDMDRHIRMLIEHPLYAFRCGDDPDELDPPRSPGFQLGGRGRRRAGG